MAVIAREALVRDAHELLVWVFESVDPPLQQCFKRRLREQHRAVALAVVHRRANLVVSERVGETASMLGMNFLWKMYEMHAPPYSSVIGTSTYRPATESATAVEYAVSSVIR